MTRLLDDDRANYAPYKLIADAAELGLVHTLVSSELGSCVARHHRERTSTRATVFLHGAAGAWTTWTPLLQAARDAGIRVENPVVLDLPGWGDATLIADSADVSVLAICTLVANVLDELGYTEWDLVGHSLGGFVAMHMASIWPERVMSVGMVSGTTFSVIRSVEHPVRNFFEVPGFTMLWRVMRILARLGPLGPALVRGVGKAGVFRALFAPLFRHGARVPRSLIRATEHDLRPRSFTIAAEVARGYPVVAAWSRIECPVRATKGDRDVFVSDADFVELARILPDSVRTVIADCGHFGIVERPGAVLAALGYVG